MAWVSALSAQYKDEVLVRLVRGESRAGAELVRRFRSERNPALQPAGNRTVADLHAAARATRSAREQRAGRRRSEQEARRERIRAAARESHLTALAARQEQGWMQLSAAIETRQPAQYDAAVDMLKDLRDVSEREKRLEAFQIRLSDLRLQHSKKSSLLQCLERAGLGTNGASARRADAGASRAGGGSSKWISGIRRPWTSSPRVSSSSDEVRRAASAYRRPRRELDWRLATPDGRPRVEFTWQGIDEGDPVSGRGWAELELEGSLRGHLYFDLGDDSGFRAVRAEAKQARSPR